MYYTVYKTINLVNNKFYIGKHKTLDPYDKYMGSGFQIKAAIKKYGIENFKKEVLFIFDNQYDMNAKEKEIVTKELISLPECYNMHEGGMGGFGHINNGSREHRERARRGGINSYKTGGLKNSINKNKFKKNDLKTIESSKKAVKARWTNLSKEEENSLKEAQSIRMLENNPMSLRMWIEKENLRILILKDEFDIYKLDGWVSVMEKYIKPTLWINNGIINKIIKRELLQDYDGWNLGKIKKV